jgi:hypothetical protein
MTTTRPTAQGISRLLAKAGFERSKTAPSRIRGFRESSPGYRVTSWAGDVRVEHVVGFRRDDERHALMVARYAEVIREAGFRVSDEGGISYDLTVSAQED